MAAAAVLLDGRETAATGALANFPEARVGLLVVVAAAGQTSLREARLVAVRGVGLLSMEQ
jgi:hypothetical protein